MCHKRIILPPMFPTESGHLRPVHLVVGLLCTVLICSNLAARSKGLVMLDESQANDAWTTNNNPLNVVLIQEEFSVKIDGVIRPGSWKHPSPGMMCGSSLFRLTV